MAGALVRTEATDRRQIHARHAQRRHVRSSPFNAWVVLKGLETLGIRMEAQSQPGAGAGALAAKRIRAVERVYYPGLESHPQHALAMAQQSGRGGAVVSFDVKAADPGRPARNAFHVVDSTQAAVASPPTWATSRPSSPIPPAPRTAA